MKPTLSKPYLKYYFDFLWAMTEKEIKARYKKAVFGFLWVVLNPLFQMIVIGLVFSYFIKIENYFLFLLTGLLPWGFFSLSLAKATPSIVYERSLLKKAVFPIESIPISIIISNFIHLLIAEGLLLFFLIISQQIMCPNIIFLIPALIWLLLFTIGFSLLTASLQVKYRDIAFFIQSALILWFYITPVLYSLDLLPTHFQKWFLFNPLTSIFSLMQFAILDTQLPNPNIFGGNILLTFAISIFGIIIFRKQHKYFVDWL